MFTVGRSNLSEPETMDQVCLDNKVRFVGDRVAAVAAESVELCKKAISLIKVDWEILPAVLTWKRR